MEFDLSGMETRELLAIWLADWFWVHSPKNDGRRTSGSSDDLDFRWSEMEAVERALRGRYARLVALRQAVRQGYATALMRIALWHMRRYGKWAVRNGSMRYVDNRTESRVTVGNTRLTLVVQEGATTHYTGEELVDMLDAVRRDRPDIGACLQDLVRAEMLRHMGPLPAPLFLLAAWIGLDVGSFDVQR